mgnify:CR=1 FL=1
MRWDDFFLERIKIEIEKNKKIKIKINNNRYKQLIRWFMKFLVFITCLSLSEFHRNSRQKCRLQIIYLSASIATESKQIKWVLNKIEISKHLNWSAGSNPNLNN